MEPKQDSGDHQKFTSLSATLIAQNHETDTQIFYTMDNTHHHSKYRINELHGRRINACFHGWVILSNHPDNVLWSLWNPLTSTLIRLPPLTRREKDSYECCLSSPPYDQASVFILLPDSVFTIVFCRLDRKRKRLKWTEMSYAKQLRTITGEDDCFLQCITCCNGKVYAMASKSYRFVIQIDIVVKGKEVVITILPFVEVPPFTYHKSLNSWYLFLKGSAIDLFYVRVGIHTEGTIIKIRDVRLYKLDLTSVTWEETLDLEDATFFLEVSDDYSACYYSSAVDSKLGGYIHVLNGSSKIIHSFHTKDKTMSLSSMVFGYTSLWQWNVFFLSVSRDSRWRACDLNFGNDDPYSYQFPVFYGQDVYALCNNERIEAFKDITDDEFSWGNVADNCPRRSDAQYFLSSCDQHLLLVIMSEFGETVEVFKLDENTTEWAKVDDLKKHMIFISDTSCICLEAKLPEMGNKIYFPRLLHDEGTKIVFYSLETCRYHTFVDKNMQESFGADFFWYKTSSLFSYMD